VRKNRKGQGTIKLAIGHSLSLVVYLDSAGVQTPAEIEELRLRTSHPVKTPE